MDEPRAYMDSQNSPPFKLGGSHHLPLYNILYDWPWGLYSNVIFLGTFKFRVPNFLKLGLSPFWKLIISCENI